MERHFDADAVREIDDALWVRQTPCAVCVAGIKHSMTKITEPEMANMIVPMVPVDAGGPLSYFKGLAAAGKPWPVLGYRLAMGMTPGTDDQRVQLVPICWRCWQYSSHNDANLYTTNVLDYDKDFDNADNPFDYS